MKPRTRVRVTPSAPPQYRNRIGWTVRTSGDYTEVVFAGGETVLLHHTEIAEDAPADVAEPEEPAVWPEVLECMCPMGTADEWSAIYAQQAADFRALLEMERKSDAG